MSGIAAGIGAGAQNVDKVMALRAYAWGRILLSGFATWALAVFVTLITGVGSFLPLIIIVGSFLVPITFMTFVLGGDSSWPRKARGSASIRRKTDELTLPLLLKTFLAGGLLGVLATAALETSFVSPSPFLYTGGALLGVAARVVVLTHLARGVRDRSMVNGMILGATVGLGFAAFQTLGYGLNILLSVTGQSVRDLTETELLRSVVTPVGYGLLTAILGGIVFAAAGTDRWRVTNGVVFGYLGASALQALWDATHQIAVLFTLLLTDTPWQPRLLGLGFLPRPSLVQLHLFTLATFIGYAFIAAIGLLWFAILRRHMRGHDVATTQPADERATPAPV